MITLSVAGRGSKHTLECDPSEKIGAVKARLAPLVSMAPADLKLIVKGKLWDDDAKTLGSMADAGATVKVDEGEPSPMVIQTSDANGAYAGMAISDELLASLKKGTQLTVAFKTAQRQDIAVPVTLIGFTAAYTQLGS